MALEFRGCSTRLKHFFLSMAVRVAESKSSAMRFLCTGSFYYTAVHAKIADKKAVVRKFATARDICSALVKYMQDPSAESLEIANAARLEITLALLFGEENLDHVHLLFARDWKFRTVHGATSDFRMTWTAGWWLDELTSLYRRDTWPDEVPNKQPSE